MEHILRSAGLVLLILLVQTTFIPFVALSGYVPDLFIPWLVYTALRRGQIEATVGGFAAGLLQDITTTQFFGLAAIAKTTCAFVAGYFFNENTTGQTLGSYRYVLIVLLCSFLHDVIFFIIFFQGTEGSIVLMTLRASMAMTLYTGVVSILPMFAFSHKYSTSWAQ